MGNQHVCFLIFKFDSIRQKQEFEQAWKLRDSLTVFCTSLLLRLQNCVCDVKKELQFGPHISKERQLHQSWFSLVFTFAPWWGSLVAVRRCFLTAPLKYNVNSLSTLQFCSLTLDEGIKIGVQRMVIVLQVWFTQCWIIQFLSGKWVLFFLLIEWFLAPRWESQTSISVVSSFLILHSF